MNTSLVKGESVIGEECHIVAREINGPRGNAPLPIEARDDVDNLILLCRNHHKLIDDQPNTFTEKILKVIRSEHENWVRESLSPKPEINEGLFYGFRVDTGTQLWNTIIECDGYTFDIVQPETEGEAYLLGNFSQNITDYGDIWNVIESKDKILVQFELNEQLKNLNESGFLVYATSHQHRLFSLGTKKSTDVWIGYVLVLKKGNLIVQRKDDEIETMMQTQGQKQSKFSNFVPVLLNFSSINAI